MRILMFGWEFPPHISGGLGTACYGLTKGLSAIGDTEVIFVVPKAWGDENPPDTILVGANQVPVVSEILHDAEDIGALSFIGKIGRAHV